MVIRIGQEDLNLRVALAVHEQILFDRSVVKTIRVSTELVVICVLGVASQVIDQRLSLIRFTGSV